MSKKKTKLFVLKKDEAVVSTDRADRGNGFITQDKQMLDIIQQAKTIAPFDVRVLITGESGVGKGVLARLIHQKSKRAKEKFIIVNSAGLPETLVESELFGYKKGAFTGASCNQNGYFEEAQKGTLFFDEIGDMGLRAQSKILLAIEDGEFYPLGSRKKVEVNVRLITASNQSLEELMGGKRLRTDLFYRLNNICFHIPPLRERQEDILALIPYFIRKSCSEYQKKLVAISKEAESFLLGYSWPGNIRQLASVVGQAVILNQKSFLDVDDFQSVFFPRREKKLLKGSVLEVNERDSLIKALKEHYWVQRHAAKSLGISPRVMCYKIYKHNILHPKGEWKTSYQKRDLLLRKRV